jgi:hypothetical protein
VLRHQNKKSFHKDMVESTGGEVPIKKLNEVFLTYCGGQDTMEGKQWAKLCKDTKLLDKKFTSTDVDLIFAKVKDKGARKINFAQF